MMVTILAEEDDCLVHYVEDETDDFYRTDDISEFISKRADICFIDFGAVCSVFDIGDYPRALRLLVKYIQDNPSTIFYFCLIMPSNFYDAYEEIWNLPNVVKVTHREWAIEGFAIRRILTEAHLKKGSLFDEPPAQCKTSSGTRCKDCKHIQKWQCGGSYFFYCGIIKSRRTSNGLKKVKCKTPSCYLFEREEGL